MPRFVYAEIYPRHISSSYKLADRDVDEHEWHFVDLIRNFLIQNCGFVKLTLIPFIEEKRLWRLPTERVHVVFVKQDSKTGLLSETVIDHVRIKNVTRPYNSIFGFGSIGMEFIDREA